MKLEDIAKLCAEARPGPWGYDKYMALYEARDGRECPDNRFIASARTLLPLLLEAAKWADAVLNCGGEPCLDEDREKLREALAAVEAVE